jgi:hypothetical protein
MKVDKIVKTKIQDKQVNVVSTSFELLLVFLKIRINVFNVNTKIQEKLNSNSFEQ